MTVRRVMALDVGDRRIGVAVSDPLGLFARPETTIERRRHALDIAAIADLVEKWDASRVVVGYPLLPSGDRGEQARKVETFASDLSAAVGVPVELFDESYTTVEARERRTLRGARRRASGPGLDAEAAAVVLEEWLLAEEQAAAESATTEGADDEPEP